MKVSVDDFAKSQRKTGLHEFVAQKMGQDAVAAKEPEKDEPVKTFVLSPTGGEIHRGESVVDRISKPETLREKIARFERLAQRVRQSREMAYAALQDSIPDGADDADDFDFEDGEFMDDFGDTIEPVKPVVTPVVPKSEPDTVPIAEPTGDLVEPDSTPDPE